MMVSAIPNILFGVLVKVTIKEISLDHSFDNVNTLGFVVAAIVYMMPQLCRYQLLWI